MVAIAASRVWAVSTLRLHSWVSHVLTEGRWPSWSCDRVSTTSKGVEFPCLCLNLGLFLAKAGGGLLQVVAWVVWGLWWGLPLRVTNLPGPLTPLALRSQWICPRNALDLLNKVYQPYPSALPPTTRCRLLHRRASPLSLGMMIWLCWHAYGACGEAASALHAMALLQVHQDKAIKVLHKGGHDPGKRTNSPLCRGCGFRSVPFPVDRAPFPRVIQVSLSGLHRNSSDWPSLCKPCPIFK